MVLIERRIQDGHLALTEGIVQRVVDKLRTDPEPRGREPVEDHQRLLSFVLLVAVHIRNFRQRSQMTFHFGGPGVQFGKVHALQRILVLGAACATADTQILDRLQHGRRSRNLCQLRTQPCNNLVHAQPPFMELPLELVDVI